MNSETKTCQNCKQKFSIELEDFDFYKKISVPPPTFCPKCRLQRRLAWLKEIVVLARGPRTAREIRQFAGGNFRDFVRLEKYLKFEEK